MRSTIKCHVASVFLCAGAAGAAAGTITWQGGNGNWFDSTWNLDGVANHAWANDNTTCVGNSGAMASITMNGWASMPELHLYNAGSINVNGQGLSPGQIHVEDASVCIIRGNNVHTASFTLNKGCLQLGTGADEKPCGGNMVVNGGKLDLKAQPSSGVSIAGNLTVNGGLARYYYDNQISNTKLIVVAGGTLDVGPCSDTVGGVQLTGGSIEGSGGTLTSVTAFDMQSGSVRAKLGGSVGLNKTTSGTVALYGVNGYTGNTAINSGTLILGGTIASGSTIVVGNGATGGALQLLQTVNANPLTLNGGTVRALCLDADPGTGGVVTCSGNSVIHTFNASGTLHLLREVTGARALIVGGGGGGGGGIEGTVYTYGGGGGQVLNLSGLALAAGDNAVVVGPGGTGVVNGTAPNGTGGSSSFAGQTTAGGGTPIVVSGAGGSSGSGKVGGGKNVSAAGGGGGDSVAGGNAASNIAGGAGGAGSLNTVIPGLTAYYGGGGGGEAYSTQGAGGLGGGGAGGAVGTPNTGGGGGGRSNGGSGIVIVCYDLPLIPGACTLCGAITVPVTSTLDAVGTGGVMTVATTMTGAGGVNIASSTNGGGVVCFTGRQDYTGDTTINSGTLSIGASSTLSSSAISISTGAVLDVSAHANYAPPSTQVYAFTVDPAGSGSAGRIKAAGLDLTNMKVSLNISAKLDDKVYVLVEYSSRTGASFSSVTGVPGGYVVDYDYNGGTQIALLQFEQGTIISVR